jgi:hypothetical protein
VQTMTIDVMGGDTEMNAKSRASIRNRHWNKQSKSQTDAALRSRHVETHPRDVVDIGLKSVRPDSTKCCRTPGQSSRVSQVILLGGSTSTGMTWLTLPHWIMITSVPIPPF